MTCDPILFTRWVQFYQLCILNAEEIILKTNHLKDIRFHHWAMALWAEFVMYDRGDSHLTYI